MKFKEVDKHINSILDWDGVNMLNKKPKLNSISFDNISCIDDFYNPSQYDKYLILKRFPNIERVNGLNNFLFKKKLDSGYELVISNIPYYIFNMSENARFYSCFAKSECHDDSLIREMYDPTIMIFMLYKNATLYARSSCRIMNVVSRKIHNNRSLKYYLDIKRGEQVLFVNHLYGDVKGFSSIIDEFAKTVLHLDVCDKSTSVISPIYLCQEGQPYSDVLIRKEFIIPDKEKGLLRYGVHFRNGL